MFVTFMTNTRGSGSESDFKDTVVNGYQVTSLRPYTGSAASASSEKNALSVMTLAGGTTYYLQESFTLATEKLLGTVNSPK